MNNKEEFDINMYAIFMIGALTFLIFVVGCENKSTHSENQINDYLVKDKKYVEKLNEIAMEYPDMTYTYIPSSTGQIKTIKGNYTVETDGIREVDAREYEKYLLMRHQNRAKLRETFNVNIEIPARPKYGYEIMLQKIQRATKYPEEAVEKNLEGTLFVEFTVNEQGQVVDVEVDQKIFFTSDENLKNKFVRNAINAVKSTNGEWLPAKQGNKPVSMKLEIPISFELEDNV